MLRPAVATDPRARLREHTSQALALLDGVSIEAHPAASMASRRRANQAAYALQAARRELQRLVGLLGPPRTGGVLSRAVRVHDRAHVDHGAPPP